MRKLFPFVTVLTIFIAMLLISTQPVYAASPVLNTPLVEGKKPPKQHTQPVLVTGDLVLNVAEGLNYANEAPKATSGAITRLNLIGTYQFKSKDNKPIAKAVRLDVSGLELSIDGVTIPSDLTWTGKGTYNLKNGRIEIHCSATSADGQTKYHIILHGRVVGQIVPLSKDVGGERNVEFTAPQSKLVITQSDGSSTVYFLTLTDDPKNLIAFTPKPQPPSP